MHFARILGEMAGQHSRQDNVHEFHMVGRLSLESNDCDT